MHKNITIRAANPKTLTLYAFLTFYETKAMATNNIPIKQIVNDTTSPSAPYCYRVPPVNMTASPVSLSRPTKGTSWIMS